MKLLLKYKKIQADQLIREKKDYWMLVRYITVDDLLVEKFPDRDFALVRVLLINEKGIPIAESTKLYEQVEECLRLSLI